VKIVSRGVLRLVVLLAAMSGLLALFSGVAHAFVSANHCEPVRRG
jgi:hypothetical protein